MKKSIFLSLLVVLIVFSCKNSGTKDSLQDAGSGWTFDTLRAEHMIHLKDDTAKAGMKIELMMVYPTAPINDVLLAKIRGLVAYAFAGKGYEKMNPGNAFGAFEEGIIRQAKGYVANAEDDEGLVGEFYQKIYTTIVDTTSISMCALTSTGEYFGGAHGAYSQIYYNIDTRDGTLIHEDNLFVGGSVDKVSKLIRAEIPNTENSNGDPITLLDDVETLQPSENFYFGNKGIVFIYNPYEIAPYSDGIIKITIPYEKVMSLVAPQYLEIVKEKNKIE